MRAWIARCVRQCVNDVLGGRQVGVADTERDDVGASGFGFGDLAVDLGEQVRGQLLYALRVPQFLPPLT